MGGWINGQMDGWVDEQTDEYYKEKICTKCIAFKPGLNE